MLETPSPDDVRVAILNAYDRLLTRLGREPERAVRSSATTEDTPEASFAGAAEAFLNVRGRDGLPRAVHGKLVGICGQAPSDYPESAEWLVHEGIDSISLNPDVANFDRDRVAAAEPPDRTATSA